MVIPQSSAAIPRIDVGVGGALSFVPCTCVEDEVPGAGVALLPWGRILLGSRCFLLPYTCAGDEILEQE